MVQKIPIVVRVFVISLVLTLLFVGTAMGEVAKDGLVAEWHFDGDTKDSSGNGNDGTINGVIFIDGKSGKALNFNGDSAYFNALNSVPLDFIDSDSFSLEAWVKTNQFANQMILSKQGGSTNQFGYALYLTQKGNIRFQVNKQNVAADFLDSKNTFEIDRWYHIVGTFDGNKMDLYIDGVLDGTKIKSFTSTTSTEPAQFRIGICNTDQGFVSFPMNGVIDEVRIYNRALTAEEIKINYEGKQSSLSLTKTTSPQSIKQGQISTVTISVENTGTTDINDIEIADTMPSDVYFVSGEISKKYTTIRPKDVREFQYVVKINDIGTFNLDPAQATYADDEGNYYSTESNSPSIKTIASLDSSSNQETSISFDIEKPNEKSIPGFEIIELIIPVIFLIFLRSKKL